METTDLDGPPLIDLYQMNTLVIYSKTRIRQPGDSKTEADHPGVPDIGHRRQYQQVLVQDQRSDSQGPDDSVPGGNDPGNFE